MILIVCAMDVEANLIKEKITNLETLTLSFNHHYYKGSINGKNVILAITGIGKVNAGVITALILEKENITKIINIGYAGGVKPNKIGEVVIVKEAKYHDVDLKSINSNYEHGQLPNLPSSFKSDKKLLEKIKNSLTLEELPLFTGDKFVTKKILNETSVYDMEGTAIYHVAYLFNKPVIAVKVISDIIDSKTQEQDYNTSEIEFSKLILNAFLEVFEII